MKKLIVSILFAGTFANAQSPEQKLLFKRAYDVMDKHCFECHGPDKQKGNLRMDSLEALLKGGDSEEPAIVQGHADKSEVMYRVFLESTDEDVMPPSKKARMSKQEIQTLIQWVDDGAVWIPEVLGKAAALNPNEVSEMHKNLGVDLTTPMTPEEEKEFRNTIEIVLRNNCTGCHGPQKEKGGLRLDTKRLAFSGGDSGPAIVPGKPEESEMYIRMTLSKDDEDVMPPSEKSRVNPTQIEHIRKWIANGARWPEPVTKLSRGGDNHFTAFQKGLDHRTKSELAALKDEGVFLEPLIWEEGGMRLVIGHTPAPLTSESYTKLKRYAKDIRWVDASRGDITSEMISFIAQLDEVLVLHFENSNLTDQQLKKLEGLNALEYLNIHSTQVTAQSIPTLRKLTNLRKLYIWNTDINADDAKRLQKGRKELRVTQGF